MSRVLTLCGIILSALIFMPSPSIDAAIYKWKDASGQIHYSSTPPEDMDADQIAKKVVQVTKTEPKAPEKQDTNPQDQEQQNQSNDPENNDSEQASAEEQTPKGYCEKQQKIVTTLKSNPYIKWQVDDKEILLEGEKKAAKIKEITEEMSKFCSPESQEGAS